MDPPLKKLKMDPFMKKLQMEISKAGESPLELLPPCILEKILGYVTEFKNIHRLLAVSITISETAGIILCFGDNTSNQNIFFRGSLFRSYPKDQTRIRQA